MSRKNNSRRRLFSLVELVAVAAIVSGMPLGSYQRAQQKAVQTECVHNLSQLGQLLRMYVLENGHYPDAAFFPGDTVKGANSIRKLLGGPSQLWTCSALPEQLRKQGLTFVYNSEIAGKSSLKNPQKKWVLIEMTCVTNNVPPPHPNGYNILFADGHVITTKRLPNKVTAAYE